MHPTVLYSRAARMILCCLAALLFVGAGSMARDFETIFRGTGEDRNIIAISVKKAPKPERLDRMVSGLEPADSLVLVYRGYSKASSLSPLAVYDGGVRTAFDESPDREASEPTIAAKIKSAYRSGGRTGAICRDGWRSKATGRGACSHHKGVSRWLYSRVKDNSAVVASICMDYRLVAGEQCGPSGIMARIQNREYR